ncbi:hypothetical protein B0H17DRAFT_941394 [Mycena rosella]|uniref:Uncharacterized protein n=1 Tax=Mycena rosella TaxID=1033263 RepID=A0AAD7DBV0_MYCRO|nr:hypothetical protein B0H17DRAFT_941394 [Mycena rosella]
MVLTFVWGANKGVRRYQTKANGDPHSDRSSTSNLKKHAEACWGEDAVQARIRGASDPATLHGGNIFASFARAEQRPVNVTHRAHTEVEELLGAGRPGFNIPSRRTVARDLNAAYKRSSARVKTLLEEYPGRLSFATDAWTSPNHRAFVAWTVHLHHEGHPLVFLLDIYEVPEVCADAVTQNNSDIISQVPHWRSPCTRVQ